VKATGRTPGKAVRGGAYPSSDAAWRRWRSFGATTFCGGEGRTVVADGHGMLLQLEGGGEG
jgi:hypothetical protein